MKVLFAIVSLFLLMNGSMCIKRHSSNLIKHYVSIFKKGNQHVITTRIKAVPSNKFIILNEDSNLITANATKLQAFRHKNALMQIHKIGQIVAFYNDLTSSYICYNEDGYLVKTKHEDFNELCIFIKINVKEHHYRYVLYSEKFGEDTKLKFDCNGKAVKATDNSNLEPDASSMCKDQSEFTLYSSSLDNYL